METAVAIKLMRLPAVKDATGLSTTWIYELMAQGKFPRAVKLGPRSRAWRSDEIQDFILSLPRADETTREAS